MCLGEINTKECAQWISLYLNDITMVHLTNNVNCNRWEFGKTHRYYVTQKSVRQIEGAPV